MSDYDRLKQMLLSSNSESTGNPSYDSLNYLKNNNSVMYQPEYDKMNTADKIDYQIASGNQQIQKQLEEDPSALMGVGSINTKGANLVKNMIAGTKLASNGGRLKRVLDPSKIEALKKIQAESQLPKNIDNFNLQQRAAQAEPQRLGWKPNELANEAASNQRVGWYQGLKDILSGNADEIGHGSTKTVYPMGEDQVAKYIKPRNPIPENVAARREQMLQSQSARVGLDPNTNTVITNPSISQKVTDEGAKYKVLKPTKYFHMQDKGQVLDSMPEYTNQVTKRGTAPGIQLAEKFGEDLAKSGVRDSEPILGNIVRRNGKDYAADLGGAENTLEELINVPGLSEEAAAKTFDLRNPKSFLKTRSLLGN